MSSYDVRSILLSITLVISVAAKQFKDVEHAEMNIDGQMTVDEISSQLTAGFIQPGRTYYRYGEEQVGGKGGGAQKRKMGHALPHALQL